MRRDSIAHDQRDIMRCKIVSESERRQNGTGSERNQAETTERTCARSKKWQWYSQKLYRTDKAGQKKNQQQINSPGTMPGSRCPGVFLGFPGNFVDVFASPPRNRQRISNLIPWLSVSVPRTRMAPTWSKRGGWPKSPHYEPDVLSVRKNKRDQNGPF